MFEALEYGIVGRALKLGFLSLRFWNPREHATDIHRRVDDRPYGGGPGMVMKFEPLASAIKLAKSTLGGNATVVHLSPQGTLLTQEIIKKQAQDSKPMILLSSRYEGIDERLLEAEVDEEWSIGNYVVSGGELPAMVLIDALTRILPGVLKNTNSVLQDSFTSGLLGFPQYTRPETTADRQVPRILLSGNHAEIHRWRLKKALGKTWRRHQDLVEKRSLSKDEQKLLDEFIKESKQESKNLKKRNIKG
ncbi:tRNA (guanosine(37)-N1)-methyltransferase TrmD [Coxiella endosymbiont of Amblyomma sculptum]|nr:tRNA (guanosine(37)-N1)-methyltransferase TrmD [Coxiella endosymbiont of Amblyomma sculptum]